MSPRFTRTEQEDLGDYYHLAEDDECYFLLEYTSGRNYSFGKANSFINNLKKPLRYQSRPEVWRYKTRAIRACSKALSEAINHQWLRTATLVPMPPSKAKSDPEYDDRMVQVARGVEPGFAVDVRELIFQTESLRISHAAGAERVTVDELLRVYRIDENLADPGPRAIGVIDDVLTAGTHFRAAKKVLSDRFPGIRIVGFFIARRVFPPDEDE